MFPSPRKTQTVSVWDPAAIRTDKSATVVRIVRANNEQDGTKGSRFLIAEKTKLKVRLR